MQFSKAIASGLLLFGGLIGESHWVQAQEPSRSEASDSWTTGEFRWRVSEPILTTEHNRLPESPDHPWLAIKDPSIVNFEGRWHLFATLRKDQEGEGRIRIGYTSFDDWDQARHADWSVLELTPDYHGAPQVFYFSPQRRWYLIYQAADEARGLKYGPCFSTNENLADPSGWTLPQPLYVVPPDTKAGLDYWVICDETHAYLFFTTLDGKMWRCETRKETFPDRGWSDPQVVLQADIFEASHTYWCRDRNEFVTMIEAQGETGRYFKAYRSDSLQGRWEPIADTLDRPFVGPRNVIEQSHSWTTNYSHGEIIRLGFDERMEIESTNLRLIFQGASDLEYRQSYGKIPWRLGLLELSEF